MNWEEVLSETTISKIINQFSEIEKAKTNVNSKIDLKDLAGIIDHTLLKPEATLPEVVQLCEEAIKFSFASVCVNPSFVPVCFDIVKSTNVKVCSVIGFPLGATTTTTKFFEAKEAIKNGAEELDMVINIGRLKNNDYEYVYNDIKAIVDITKSYLCTSKVILETCLLTDDEKIKACYLSKEAGADFVKTSTGFSKSGAKTRDVALMKFVVGDSMKVKASGGIRSYEDAIDMISAGASRLGASAGVKIISGKKSESIY